MRGAYILLSLKHIMAYLQQGLLIPLHDDVIHVLAFNIDRMGAE